MPPIEQIIQTINAELAPQFAERLRMQLIQQDKAWLVEQIIRLSLDADSLSAMDRQDVAVAQAQKRSERTVRVREMALDESKLIAFLARYKACDRERLIRMGYLVNDPPPKGTALIPPACRSASGEALLTLAKDMLFALLFGDEATDTTLHRTQRELLTITLPCGKAEALDFLQAATELSAHGTWHDPQGVSNDQRAENVRLEIEFGEVESENIGHGIVRALALINDLEINEQVLYARMEDIEESTLIV